MKHPHILMRKWGWLVGGLVLLAGLFYLVEEVAYADRVFPGVRVGQTEFGSQSLAAVTQLSKELVRTARHQRITLTAPGFSKGYPVDDWGIVWLPEATAQAAFQFGRGGNPVQNFFQRLQAVTLGARIPAIYRNQPETLDKLLAQLKHELDRAGVDGEVVIDHQQAIIKPAVVGKILDEVELRQLLQQRWQTMDFRPVELPIKESLPVFDDELTQLTADKINRSLASPYILVFKDREIALAAKDIWDWVEVIKQNGSPVVRLRPADVESYLQKLKTQVDQPVQEAILVIQDGQVLEFQPDQLGISLQAADTAARLQASLLTDQHRVEAVANYREPLVKLGSLNRLGISELVARGESNFTGSPKNRRHNIKIGATRFDKVLLAPNEKFSFNKLLGEVDETTGYLPEMVIKGDETTPEFGGGLCQVSTTAFRAALRGGYPIKARQNHSYRVSYYEPAGTDATVYQPYPDLQFLNDTPYYILIHTYIKENNLYFDFYSTKTSRRVEIEGPRIYNVTEPPPPIYIETSDLPEGEEKKIDTAHRGAEAIVYRHIYDDKGKEIRKDTFKSFYIPWPAKYLVGMAAAPKVETDLGNVPPETTATEALPVSSGN